MAKWLQGDPTICSFSRALDDWAGDIAQRKPLCLTCEYEFQVGNLPPAFMLVEVDVQENGRPVNPHGHRPHHARWRGGSCGPVHT